MIISKYNEIRKYKIEKFYKMIEVIVIENNMIDRWICDFKEFFMYGFFVLNNSYKLIWFNNFFYVIVVLLFILLFLILVFLRVMVESLVRRITIRGFVEDLLVVFSLEFSFFTFLIVL